MFQRLAFASNNLVINQVLFPNEGVVTLLARIIGILGPIDAEMLQNGQETNKYFTDDHELYSLNEVSSHNAIKCRKLTWHGFYKI